MSNIKDSRHRVNVTFEVNDYEKIRQVAAKQGKDPGTLVREWALDGLNGNLNRDNIDFILPLIQETVRNVLLPELAAMRKMEAKTCIQAGAAAYLSAEAIFRFVPEDYRTDVKEAYEQARKKAVHYLRNNSSVPETTTISED